MAFKTSDEFYQNLGKLLVEQVITVERDDF